MGCKKGVKDVDSGLNSRINSIEKQQMHKVYCQVCVLAALLHCAYIPLFRLVPSNPMALYNVFSVIFYMITMILVDRGYQRLAICMVHVEVSMFVCLAVHTIGWGSGFQLLLIACASLVYFCPFNHRLIPYFISIAEGVLFVALYAFWGRLPPLETPFLDVALDWIYLGNAVSCFGVILSFSFLSKLSASTTKRELLAENENLEVLATHDSLTGLRLRRSMEELMGELWDQRKNQVFSMSIVDIDDFKQVNDRYGHALGDVVLQKFSALICEHASENALLGRWGGEEFLVVLPNTSKHDAVNEMESLRSLVAGLSFSEPAGQFHVTATFGVSESSEPGNLKDMIALADERLYLGKKEGKNQVRG